MAKCPPTIHFPIRAVCFWALLMLCGVALGAQPRNNEGIRQPRILLLLDGSSSMLEPWEKVTRFKEAGNIVSKLIDSIYSVNPGVEFGLRVYGHQSPAQDNNCTDSKQEVMFSKNNAVQMALRLASLHPYGVSPIAYSLREAADNDLVDEVRNAYAIILITDGGESCGGDICAVVKTLIERKIYFRPYIISLVDYAPLRDQYACLGTYLQVTKDKEMPTAVGTIVDAYRPLLSMPIMAAKIDDVAKPNPNIKTVTLPAFKPERSTVASMTDANGYRRLFIPAGRSVALQRRSLPPIRVDKPVPEPVVIKRDTLRPSVVVKRDTVATRPPKHDTVTAILKPVRRDTAIAKVTPKVLVPKTSLPRRDTAKTVVLKPVKPKVTVRPEPPPKPRETPFTTETIDDKETNLAIAFTDGHGKFYATTPQLQLLDAVTGKLVKQFFRTVDEAGNPDPIEVAAGTYNLLVVGKSNLLMRRVTVQPKKRNKLTVVVSNGSLRFAYRNNPDRPVSEFSASVKILFEPGPTVIQRCTAELEYRPGNYTIEVNTRPVWRANVDIDFGAMTEIRIDEPGWVRFTNGAALGEASLFTQLGDRFVRFYGVHISGNPEEQKVQLQPGAYEAHWRQGPQTVIPKDNIVKFFVRSNEVTDVELKP